MLAVNNYRANGGGAFPHVASATEVWAESTEIRTRIAEWVTAKGCAGSGGLRFGGLEVDAQRDAGLLAVGGLLTCLRRVG
ncbi:hypothetical protein ACRAWF_23930 [Streptomyces sp. L7]